jgi:murein DD-endopeptidase MepM/ murein hydrolase activator NlpD
VLQIILVHRRLAQARTLTLGTRHFVIAIVLAFLCLAIGSILMMTLLLQTSLASSVPGLRELVLNSARLETDQSDRHMRESVNAMAIKLAEMQGQLARLEALGDRVSGLAGLNPKDFNLSDPPPRGGAEPVGGHDITLEEFRTQLDSLSLGLERRSDFLNIAESNLMTAKLKDKMMPTILPVNVIYNASGFGWRIDPFNGRMAMHAGVDFVANPGTPIVAAAGGVVIAAEWHHDFGNMIEIDHGNDITTLYAHASKVYVKVGDIVRRNQHIADVGATGRATGPHLHFEVHVRGVPQNPVKFLDAGGAPNQAQMARTELSQSTGD